LIAAIYKQGISRLSWHTQQQHAPCPILKLSLNGASTIFSLASLVIDVSLCNNNAYTMSWRPVQPKHCTISLLPHLEHQRQQSLNNFWFCILGNQGIARILELITEPLTAVVVQNTTHKWENIESKMIDITTCKAFKK